MYITNIMYDYSETNVLNSQTQSKIKVNLRCPYNYIEFIWKLNYMFFDWYV